MKNRGALLRNLLAGVAVVAVINVPTSAQQQNRPNVVILNMYEHGRNDFCAYSTITRSLGNTPANIDKIKKKPDNYEIEVAAPSMTKNDFKVQLDGNTLTISSERNNQKEQKDDKYTSREFSYESFTRTFNLQKDVVDTEKIEAKY